MNMASAAAEGGLKAGLRRGEGQVLHEEAALGGLLLVVVAALLAASRVSAAGGAALGGLRRRRRGAGEDVLRGPLEVEGHVLVGREGRLLEPALGVGRVEVLYNRHGARGGQGAPHQLPVAGEPLTQLLGAGAAREVLHDEGVVPAASLVQRLALGQTAARLLEGVDADALLEITVINSND